MNLLKQTALILGLASLSMAGWTLFNHWRQKIAIQFSIVCFVVAIWSLSFVSHVTLDSRLSYDIHRFFNIWLAPFGVMLLERLLISKDRFSHIIKWVAWVGAIILSVMVSFSLDARYDSSPLFVKLVKFWPSMVFFQFLNIVFQDVVLKRTVSLEFISADKRTVIYIGLAISLLTCSFDHVPEMGFVIPAIGNLLFTAYLIFSGMVIFPQRLLRVDAWLSRFFATLILALVITGFFALLYPYISESFPLFLLNSFLLSFSTLVLWNPLVAFFRYVGKKFLGESENKLAQSTEQFKQKLNEISTQDDLSKWIEEYMKLWIHSKSVRFVRINHRYLPDDVRTEFLKQSQDQGLSLIHRYVLDLEREQTLSEARQISILNQLHYLDQENCDLVFPIIRNGVILGVIQLQVVTTADEWLLGLQVYSEVAKTLQLVAPVLDRLDQLTLAKESERLATLGEMAAGLAHEIRNPLGAILGAAALSHSASSSEPWIKIIQEEVGRLNRLVTQFLSLSQSPKERPEAIDGVLIVKSVIDLLQPSIPYPIQFTVSDAVINMQMVPDHLRQIILNLLQNAILSMDGRPDPRIEVRMQSQSALDSEFVQIKIIDRGLGMNDDQLQRVFQPFFTTFRNGTGLGLSICERLIRFNQGSIRIHSREGEGTVVTLMVPKGISS